VAEPAKGDDADPVWTRHHLPKHSLEQLQNAFAKALLELTGENYDVDIFHFDRRPANAPYAAFRDDVDIRMRVSASRKDGM
jgi:hypothetical protein